MKRLITISFAMFLMLMVHAQNQKHIDSLILMLNSTENDTARVNLLNKIAQDLFYVNYDQIQVYGQKALDLSEDLNYKKGTAEAYNNLGIYYRSKGLYDVAIDYFFNSLEIMEGIGYRNGIARCYNLIGIVYYFLGNYPLSLDYYNKALAINIEQKDKKWMAGNYNNIGMIYEKLGEYSLALEYYLKSLETNFELNNKNWIANNYGNIGSLYQQTGNPKSLEYFLMRLQINEELNDLSGIAISNFLIGRYYNSQQKYEEAISFLTRGYILADSSGNLLQMNNAAKELSNAFAQTGNFYEAYRYHVIHKDMSDSLNFQENSQKLARIEMQYKFRKDQQVEKLKNQKTELFYSLVGLVLGLLILASILILGRQRAKVRQQELYHKKLELENNMLREELQFKEKTFQDNVKYLVNKNELINKVSERLVKEKNLFKKENQKIIEEVILELQSNKDRDILEEFETRFKQINSSFYENLNQISPELTASEKKLCAFIKLKMTTKEISAITGHSVSSIETSRTRLRKKLKIHEMDVSLQEFLEKI